MKFVAYSPATLLIVSAMLLDTTLLVQALPMTSTIRKDSLIEDSDVAMPSASEIFAQWGAASAAGLNDLSVGELNDQLYLGQLHKEKSKGGNRHWGDYVVMVVLILLAIFFSLFCVCRVLSDET